jgi:biotin carboxylase
VRRLLVLGAGPAQLGLLEAARALDDVYVIAVDRDPLAAGLRLADERAVLSSEDEQGIDRLARAREIHGLVSPGADWPVGIAARVAERMGLPHPLDGATAAVATSKVRQRERFAAAGVPHPRATADLDAISLPCVVKAVDRQGQRGLALVTETAELEPAIAEARAASRGGGVLVEELIVGPEVTVNAVSVDGVFVPLLVTDRVTADPPAFGVALAHVTPSAAADERAVETARAAVESIGIRNGPSYTQLRVGRAGPVVMEVAARLGGGHDAELVEAATGVELNALAVAFALGEQPSAPRVESRGGGAIVFLVPPAGELVRIDGVDGAAANPGVEWVRVYREPGHVFGELRRGADRAGAVLAVGRDRTQALDRATRAADSVTFVTA